MTPGLAGCDGLAIQAMTGPGPHLVHLPTHCGRRICNGQDGGHPGELLGGSCLRRNTGPRVDVGRHEMQGGAAIERTRGGRGGRGRGRGRQKDE
jgi:hypothetical protein